MAGTSTDEIDLELQGRPPENPGGGPVTVTIYKAHKDERVGVSFFTPEEIAEVTGNASDAILRDVDESLPAAKLLSKGDRVLSIASISLTSPMHAAAALREAEGYIHCTVLPAPPDFAARVLLAERMRHRHFKSADAIILGQGGEDAVAQREAAKLSSTRWQGQVGSMPGSVGNIPALDLAHPAFLKARREKDTRPLSARMVQTARDIKFAVRNPVTAMVMASGISDLDMMVGGFGAG